MNTIIRYEGASKTPGAWTVQGQCSQDQAAAIRNACRQKDGHAMFVPEIVSMPTIDGRDVEHRLIAIEMTGSPADDSRSVYGLIDAFHAAQWPTSEGQEKMEDTITDEVAVNTILAMLGNVNHDRPGGHNDAQHRGGLLEDIRAIAKKAQAGRLQIA